ncbi:MAG: hypothetical protein ACLFVP_06145 [Candidatus Bathyarchaeia archaeon]
MSEDFEDFYNPETGRISHLRPGSRRCEKAIKEGWKRVTSEETKTIRKRIKETTYRGVNVRRTEEGWKTEITGDELFKSHQEALKTIGRILFKRSEAEAKKQYRKEAKKLDKKKEKT